MSRPSRKPNPLTDKHITALVHEQKDEALIKSMSDGIIVRDQSLKIIKINPALTELIGYSEEDLLGYEVPEVIPVRHLSGRPLLPREYTGARTIKSGKAASGTYNWTHKDGSILIVDVVTSPYMIDSQLAGTVTIVRDVSDRVAIDKAKTEFVSLAAHQLRTPLSSINWYLEMLKDDKAGQLTKNQQDYLSEIVTANQRMVALVNDLLNASRIDLGTFAIRPVPTDIEEVINSVLSELSNEITRKALHITTAFTGAIDRYQIDPQLARIVFQNLIGNAVKYTPKGGSIDIYAILDYQKLLITIDDTGYGIPASQQDKVFNKLFRADNVVRRDTEGTGLGLYLVKAIVEKSGGTIDFVSKLNQGTTFTVIFPCGGMKQQAGGHHLAAAKKL
jgi:PAS domain S-box-containing protein